MTDRDQFHLDWSVQRQLRDAHCGARVEPGFSEERAYQLR